MFSGPSSDVVESSSRFLQFFSEQSEATPTTKITAVRAEEFDQWLSAQPDAFKAWVSSAQFTAGKADAGKFLLEPGADGSLARVVVVVADPDGVGDWFSLAGLPGSLPKNRTYELEGLAGVDPGKAALAWALGAYSFDRYKSKKQKPPPPTAASAQPPPPKFARLVWPRGADAAAVTAAAAATFMVRDLISTPAEDLGPAALQAAVEDVARAHGASVQCVAGEELRAGYPQVHAVGRAAAPRHAPRLLDMQWGRAEDPKVTLVGKGVCFDSGGLDIKPSSGMRTMKKDMGGAAQVLGLAHMVMSARLPVRLRVLIPAVENAVSGESFRPGDILTARNGLTSEISNTDAEGRLVLADALVAACEGGSPDLLVDCATLTGAGRVALGADVPAVFVNDEQVAADLQQLSATEHDLVWRLPLYRAYAKRLESRIADVKNAAEGDGGYGGAITAALYLDKFVKEGTKWVHMDFMAYNQATRPGRPEGGEAMGMRALYALIRKRFPPA